MMAQAELSLLGNREVMQSDLYNPASFHEEGLHFGFPSMLYSLHHTGPGYRDLIDSQDGLLLLKVRELYSALNDANELAINVRLQTFKVKYGKGAWTVGIEHELVSESSIQYPDALIQLYVDGNQPWIGQEVEIGPMLQIESFHSIGVLLARRFGSLTLGLRPRLLVGQHLVHTTRSQAAIRTDDSYYKINFKADFLYHNVGVLDFEEGNPLNYQIGNLNQWNFASGNIGTALDGGLEWQIDERTNFGLSFTDVGSIQWKKGLKTYQSQGDHPYGGTEIANLFTAQEIDFVGAIDTLRSLLDFELIDGTSRFSLSPRYFIFFSYRPSNTLALTLQMQHNTRYQDPLSIGISASARVTKRLKIGLVAAQKYGHFNAGLQGALVLKKWLSFISLENLLNGMDPLASPRFGVRAGINFHLNGTPLFD